MHLTNVHIISDADPIILHQIITAFGRDLDGKYSSTVSTFYKTFPEENLISDLLKQVSTVQGPNCEDYM